jgi:hypothetical protein
MKKFMNCVRYLLALGILATPLFGNSYVSAAVFLLCFFGSVSVMCYVESLK